MRRSALGALLAPLLTLLPTTSGEGQQDPTLDRLVERALAANPDVQSALARWEAARERPLREGSLPDPMFMATLIRFRGEGLGIRGAGETWYAVQQEVPFFGKLGLRAGVARREAERVGAEVEALRLDLVEAVRVAYYEALHARSLEEIALVNRDLAEGTLEVALARYEVGAGEQPDLLLGRVERARIDNDLAEYRAMRRRAAAELEALLGEPLELGPTAFVEPAAPGPEAPLDLDSLVVIALDQRPELRSARLAVARDTLALRLAGKAYLPDLLLGLEYWVGEGANEEPLPDERYVASLGLTVPWLWSGKHRAGVREARAGLRASEHAVRETANRIRREVELAAAAVEAAAEQARSLNATIVPEAVLNLEGAAEAYRTDRTPFLTVLDAQRSLNELRVARHTALVEWLVARARLDRALGTPPGGGDTAVATGGGSGTRNSR